MKPATANRTTYALLGLILLAGCREPAPWAQLGPSFVSSDTPSAGKALVYIYWPAESSGNAKRAWITPSEQVIEEILKGGFLSIEVAPGTTSLSVEILWNLTFGHSFATQDCGGVRLNARRGEVLYLKMEERTKAGFTRFDFREVEPAAAAAEIKKCRRMVSPPG